MVAPLASSPIEPPRRDARASAFAVLLLVLALLLLGGCASLPANVERSASSAVADVAATPLARVAAASTPADKLHLSGVRLLPDAQAALELRLALVREARVSIDAQYYLIARDGSGRHFLHELRRAAERGVRVRLLVDDLHAGDSDAELAALDALPNAEVRLFNPLPVRGSGWMSRLLLSLHEFERVNRRMHNKLFVADNSFAVTGGRNIADEYFMRGDSAHFIDMDLLASGPVVRELSDLFDRFWNSEVVYPVGALVDGAVAGADRGELAPSSPAGRPHDDARDNGDRAHADGAPRHEEDALLAELRRGRLELRFAPVQLFADVPAKAAATGGATRPPTAMQSTLSVLASAEREVQVVSPYFVPGSRGMEMIRQATARGVHLAVTTNSLASTDEPMAYWGYARYRAELLGLGVSLVELSPNGAPRASLRGGLSGSVGRLHAKVALVDQRWLLVGSLNMDARSSRANTELALVIDDVELAAEMSALLQRQWHDEHYRLRIADAPTPAGDAPAGAGLTPRRVEWVSASPGRPTRVHASEPQVPWLSRVRLGLMSVFVPEELL